MMHPANELNKAFESRVRLGIMSMLMVNDWVEFSSFKETLQLTDGNLASHLSTLENLGYVQLKKSFIGRKPNTTYAATKTGQKAFRDHLDLLEKLLKM